MAHHNISPLKNQGLRLVGRGPELRNPVTGLPEQHFYRPTTKEQKAAQNGLGIMLVGFLIALPFWFGVAQEWRQILASVEKAVAK